MAIYQNTVPKNVKARTILKTGTLGEWELASNFIPLKGEPVIVLLPQQHGPGWYYNATDKKYYSNSYQQQTGGGDPTTVEAQVITENKTTGASDDPNNPFYYIDDSVTPPIIKAATGTYVDYPVDKYGYVYTTTSSGLKEYCETVNWDFRIGDGINKVIDLPKFVEPEIKDNEWYIGGIGTGVSATPDLTIENGYWKINGVVTTWPVYSSPLTIYKTYTSIDEMIAAAKNPDTEADVPFNGLAIIDGDIETLDTAKLFMKTNTTEGDYAPYIYLTDLSGANGIQGTPGTGIVSIVKTNTQGLIDTYTITLSDNQTTTFTVTNGSSGTPGEDYILTEEDKQEIADLVLAGLNKWQGGSF